VSMKPSHLVPASHPWRDHLVPSRADQDRADERERVRRVEAERVERTAAALVRLADGIELVEALDPVERDEARDQALCQAVVRSAAGPRRIVDDAD
jgi:hypothetical protein